MHLIFCAEGPVDATRSNNATAPDLITEIGEVANIEYRQQAEVSGADGDGRLETLHVRDRRTGSVSADQADALFLLIGAAPFTS